MRPSSFGQRLLCGLGIQFGKLRWKMRSKIFMITFQRMKGMVAFDESKELAPPPLFDNRAYLAIGIVHILEGGDHLADRGLINGQGFRMSIHPSLNYASRIFFSSSSSNGSCR